MADDLTNRTLGRWEDRSNRKEQEGTRSRYREGGRRRRVGWTMESWHQASSMGRQGGGEVPSGVG